MNSRGGWRGRPNRNNHDTIENRRRPNQNNHDTVENRRKPNQDSHDTVDYRRRPNPDNHDTVDYSRRPNPDNHDTVDYRRRPNPDNHDTVDYRRRPNTDDHNMADYRRRPNSDNHDTVDYRRRPNSDNYDTVDHRGRPNPDNHDTVDYRRKPNPDNHDTVDYRRRPNTTVDYRRRPNTTVDYRRKPNPDNHDTVDYRRRPNTDDHNMADYRSRPNSDNHDTVDYRRRPNSDNYDTVDHRRPNPDNHDTVDYSKKPNRVNHDTVEYRRRPNQDNHHTSENRGRANQDNHKTVYNRSKPNPDNHDTVDSWDQLVNIPSTSINVHRNQSELKHNRSINIHKNQSELKHNRSTINHNTSESNWDVDTNAAIPNSNTSANAAFDFSCARSVLRKVDNMPSPHTSINPNNYDNWSNEDNWDDRSQSKPQNTPASSNSSESNWDDPSWETSSSLQVCQYGETAVQLDNESRQNIKQSLDLIYGPKFVLKKCCTNNADGGVAKEKSRRLSYASDRKYMERNIYSQKDDLALINEVINNRQHPRYKNMLSARQKLPAWSFTNNILDAINKYSVVVITGETGCGKTTQVCQFILDDWISSNATWPDGSYRPINIICTEPRRIAAIAASKRVSQEQGQELGDIIGYSVHLEGKSSVKTRLLFCTIGVLIRRIEHTRVLEDITHIMIDEVHERSAESDLLLLILKDTLSVHPNLKIILMSATINAEIFCSYFGGAPVITIPRNVYEVEHIFLEDLFVDNDRLGDNPYNKRQLKDAHISELQDISSFREPDMLHSWKSITADNVCDDYLSVRQFVKRYLDYSDDVIRRLFIQNTKIVDTDLIADILLYVVNRENENKFPQTGSILIFLPGIANIKTLHSLLCSFNVFNENDYLILPLHSSLSVEEQSRVFWNTKNQRKIILATNIAETSITIDDCTMVIDSGKMNEKRYDSDKGMSTMDEVWISGANALQRSGRAGRVMNGVCIHLYTRNRYNHLRPQPIPEIQRISLDHAILTLKILPYFSNVDIVKVMARIIEPPSIENTSVSVAYLTQVGALDKNENLTGLGFYLAALPVDVSIGKLIFLGTMFQCLDSVLTIAACYSLNSSIFHIPYGSKTAEFDVKHNISRVFSDHLVYLKAYQMYTQVNGGMSAARNFARNYSLSINSLKSVTDMKYQLLRLLQDAGHVPSSDAPLRSRTIIDNISQITGDNLNKNGSNDNLLCNLICGSLYPNLVKISPGQFELDICVKNHERIFLHPSSINNILKDKTPPFLVYQEKVKTKKIYLRDTTAANALSVMLFADNDSALQFDDRGENHAAIIFEAGWLGFFCTMEDALLLYNLRIAYSQILRHKIEDPTLDLAQWPPSKSITSTIVALLSKLD